MLEQNSRWVLRGKIVLRDRAKKRLGLKRVCECHDWWRLLSHRVWWEPKWPRERGYLWVWRCGIWLTSAPSIWDEPVHGGLIGNDVDWVGWCAVISLLGIQQVLENAGCAEQRRCWAPLRVSGCCRGLGGSGLCSRWGLGFLSTPDEGCYQWGSPLSSSNRPPWPVWCLSWGWLWQCFTGKCPSAWRLSYNFSSELELCLSSKVFG